MSKDKEWKTQGSWGIERIGKDAKLGKREKEENREEIRGLMERKQRKIGNGKEKKREVGTEKEGSNTK